MASFASPYRRCADQPVVSSSLESELQATLTARAAAAKAASTLLIMGRDDYSEWDATFVAPLEATVPLEMGGLRLDQALGRLFHQYSRNRLQEWLRAGHITVDGKSAAARTPVTGGGAISRAPPSRPSRSRRGALPASRRARSV